MQTPHSHPRGQKHEDQETPWKKVVPAMIASYSQRLEFVIANAGKPTSEHVCTVAHHKRNGLAEQNGAFSDFNPRKAPRLGSKKYENQPRLVNAAINPDWLEEKKKVLHSNNLAAALKTDYQMRTKTLGKIVREKHPDLMAYWTRVRLARKWKPDDFFLFVKKQDAVKEVTDEALEGHLREELLALCNLFHVTNNRDHA